MLIEHFNAFLNHIGLNQRDVFYFWPKDQNAELEDAVNLRFDGYHNRMLTALRRNDNDALMEVMRQILLWGGIIRWNEEEQEYRNDLRDETYTLFASILRRLYNHWNDNQLFDGGRLLVGGDFVLANTNTQISYSCPVCTQTTLSSWTKILAAFDTRRFWIYDSRVAIALSFIYANEHIWFIPGANNAEANRLRGEIIQARGNNAGNPTDSYRLYLEKMRGIRNGNPVNRRHYEKKLFVLGGLLTDYFTMSRSIHGESGINMFFN